MKGDAFEALGARLRDDLTRHEEVDRVSETRTRRQLLARMGTSRAPRRGLQLLLGATALASVAAALWLWTPGTTREPLRFWVEDRAGHVDEWVTARDAEQSLRFSDGSSLIAGPRTTTRVMHISPDGAQLTLERGGIDAHVVHREASRWQVAAGPFVVHVTGTRFHVAWDPQTEKLAVKVTEGRVEVTGDGVPKHVLTAGSSIELVAEHGRTASAEPVPVSAPVAVAPVPVAPSASAATDEEELIHPRKLEKKPDFRELSTAGHYREALQAVEQQGFSSTCESLGARDLLTLASTARLAGRPDLSREAYHTARRRFPGSTEAGISAFSLGRLASDAGRANDAIGWFTRYLNEQPSGQLAREASGRLLELLRKGGDAARARQAAESYLARYPSGPHATLARSMLAPQ